MQLVVHFASPLAELSAPLPHHLYTHGFTIIYLGVLYKFQPHSYFSPLKTVSLHRVHTPTRTRWVAPCLSYYSPRSFGQSNQSKIQCCHNPKQNISSNFHSIWAVRWRWGKMGNLLLGQPTYYSDTQICELKGLNSTCILISLSKIGTQFGQKPWFGTQLESPNFRGTSGGGGLFREI